MFTLQKIKEAHSKVRSGADFPAYAQALKEMSIKVYETSVANGQTTYKGKDGTNLSSDPNPELLQISEDLQPQTFIKELKEHQAGKTDFPRFRKICASSGIKKWMVDLDEMSCTYFAFNNEVVYKEDIPPA